MSADTQTPAVGQPLLLADHGHGREWARVFRIGDEDTERLWNAIAQATLDAPSMSLMPALREIAASDVVELTAPTEAIPAGARGGVLELRNDGTAMVEITSLPLDSVERIIFVALAQLRRVG
jgi:hypothetical protein